MGGGVLTMKEQKNDILAWTNEPAAETRTPATGTIHPGLV
jgi:hypothetical protein